MGFQLSNIDDLLALNRQLSTLFKAGVPLPSTPQKAWGFGGGRLAKIADELTRKVASGATISQALEKLPGVPAFYRYCLLFAERTGQPGEALEAMSQLLERVRQLRSLVRSGVVYPCFVALLTCIFCAGLMWNLIPALREFGAQTTQFGRDEQSVLGNPPQQEIQLPTAAFASQLLALPLLVGLMGVIWLWSLRNSGSFWARLSPWRLARLSNQSVFVRLLALAMQRGLPLHESLTMAAEAAGDPRLSRLAASWVNQVRAGQPLQATERELNDPNLAALRAVLSTGNAGLPSQLERLADRMERLTILLTKQFGVLFPLLSLCLLGAAPVLIHCLIFFWPWSQLLYQLTQF